MNFKMKGDNVMKRVLIKRILILTVYLTIAVFVPGLIQAQARWIKTFGGTGNDDGYSVQQTSDNGYVIAGTTTSFGAGECDVYLINTDAGGNTLWTRTYGGTHYDLGRSVQQTSDGGYVIAGYTHSFGPGRSDVYLIKTDAGGNTLWTSTYGGTDYDRGWSVQQTSDGGYVIAGGTESFGAGSCDVYLIKTNASGNTLWTRNYGGTGDDWSCSVQQTSDGGYVIAGGTESFGAGSEDVYLIKTDADGNTLWTRNYGGTGDDYGRSVQQTSDGGYVIAGGTESFGAGSCDVYLIKTNASGNTLWTRNYGGTGDDWSCSVQQTSDGGYVIAGWTDSFGAGERDIYLIKTDVGGNTLWTRNYGGTGDDWSCSVQQTSDGGYVIAGYTESFGAGRKDVYLIKTDAYGNTPVEEENPERIVRSFMLFQNYPNPFNPETTISYNLPKQTYVTLNIYNIVGKKVITLCNTKQNAGYHSVTWNAKDATSGMYFYTLITSGGFKQTKKMVLMK